MKILALLTILLLPVMAWGAGLKIDTLYDGNDAQVSFITFGTVAPGTCTTGAHLFIDTDATAGQNIYACTATNTWTLQGDGNTATPTNLSISGQTSGDILYFNGSIWTRLAKGANNSLFATDGDGAIGWATTFSFNSKEVIKTTSATLTAAEVAGTILSNYGETDDADLILTLPDLDALPGANFVYHIAAAMATNDTCVKAAADDLFYLAADTGAANGCICNAAPAIGDKLTCYAATSGASAVTIFCEATRGTWAIVADAQTDCPD